MGIPPDKCIRLYSQDGRHVLSLLWCPSGTDVATPDGEVLYCDGTNDLDDILRHLQGCEKPIDQPCRKLPLKT